MADSEEVLEKVRQLQRNGVAPLFIAINTGDLDAVKRLIAGLPVDCDDLITDTGHDGHTPLELRESVARGGSTCEWKTRGY